MADLNLITTDNPQADAPRLPALPAPELSVEYLGRIKEILESLLGRRGSNYDRAVTFRDLFAQGESETALTPEQLEQWLAKSETLRALKRKIGAVEELAGAADELRAQLDLALTDVARARKSDIRTIEQKIQTESLSIASRLKELTASVGDTAAGVRSFDSAYADTIRAVATKVEQLSATGGNGTAYIEEQLQAVSDLVDGLSAQYSLKVQTNPVNGQPPVIAGINLSATSPVAGPGTSALIFLAQTVQFLTDAGAVAPFSIVGNQVKVTNLIAEALEVVMADGTVVLDAGKTLTEQTRIRPNLAASIMSWRGFAGGATPNTSQGDARFINHQYLHMPAGQVYTGAESNPLGIRPNEWYTVSFDAYCEGAARALNVDMYGGGVDSVGTYVTLTNVQTHYKFTEQMGNFADATARAAWLRVWTVAAGSAIVVSNVKVEIGTNESAWCDDVITQANATNRVFIPNLATLALYAGDIQLGPLGALRQNKNAFNDALAGLFIGAKANGNPVIGLRTNNGATFLADPENNVLSMNGGNVVGASISQPILDAFTYSVASEGDVSGPNGALSSSTTLTITGNNGPHTVVWSFSRLSGGIPSTPVFMDIGNGGRTASISATATNTTINVQISAVITGLADQRTLTYLDTISLTFGTA